MKDFQVLVGLASSIIHDCQVCLNSALKEIGLGSAEANVLMCLYGSDGGVRQDDIVAATEVSKPAISRTVASLEAKGYVVREPHPKDRRSRVVSLTDKARRGRKLIQQQYSDLVAAAARGIPEDRVTDFIEVFSQVSRNISLHRASKRE